MIKSCAGCKSIQVSDAYGNKHECDLGVSIEETENWKMHYERENMCWMVKSRPKDGKCSYKYASRKIRRERRNFLFYNRPNYEECTFEVKNTFSF